MTTPTPMMQQWHDCKKNAQDALLLFQMGDFYEVFHDDAVTAAKELDLTLTKRQETPMAGVPVHTLDGYVEKLVAKGYRVAIAAQVEDPKQAKGLVRREVVRIVTPGTVLSGNALQEKANNYFISLNQVGALFGLACIDLSTGEFKVTEFEEVKALHTELFRLRPAEIYTSEKFKDKHQALLSEVKLSFNCLITAEENWRFDHKLSYETLLSNFKVQNLDGFGLKGKVASINAAGGLVSYLQDTLLHSLEHLDEISSYSTSQFMVLDSMTQANLEIVESRATDKSSSLLSVLDHTNTSMGGRLLRQMLLQPLLNCDQIQHRHIAVGALVENALVRRKISEHLSIVRDVERLIAKVCTNSASPKDLQAISSSFKSIPFLKEAVFEANAPLLQDLATKLEALPEMTSIIDEAIADEPPIRVSDGGVIRPGFSSELDDLRLIRSNSKEWIARYQNDLRETYGIKTLKVGFNRMFGYYIEVSKGQTDKMPDTFQRRQTLVNAERYISPELKEYEGKVMSAEERIGAIEGMLFQEIKVKLVQFTSKVKRVSSALALLDALTSLATAAFENGYTRPVVDDSLELNIEGGRHPVIERSAFTEKFTPNKTLLNNDSERLILLTGPNMAGKSTYIRQVALITLMAQVGSFVPASNAKIGLVDKIFTRIGASDELSRGQSTFMVEMTETANILNNATDRSLVILDEIGRGTSTYDGISIAWAVAEYLLTAEGKRAKTLFATHYWELTKLEELIPGAVNYNVAVQEVEDNIVFLHKIVRGGTDRSYGIHVARLAGMPKWVLDRSGEILEHLEENVGRRRAFEPTKTRKKPPTKKETSMTEQLTFF